MSRNVLRANNSSRSEEARMTAEVEPRFDSDEAAWEAELKELLAANQDGRVEPGAECLADALDDDDWEAELAREIQKMQDARGWAKERLTYESVEDKSIGLHLDTEEIRDVPEDQKQRILSELRDAIETIGKNRFAGLWIRPRTHILEKPHVVMANTIEYDAMPGSRVLAQLQRALAARVQAEDRASRETSEKVLVPKSTETKESMCVPAGKLRKRFHLSAASALLSGGVLYFAGGWLGNRLSALVYLFALASLGAGSSYAWRVIRYGDDEAINQSDPKESRRRDVFSIAMMIGWVGLAMNVFCFVDDTLELVLPNLILCCVGFGVAAAALSKRDEHEIRKWVCFWMFIVVSTPIAFLGFYAETLAGVVLAAAVSCAVVCLSTAIISGHFKGKKPARSTVYGRRESMPKTSSPPVTGSHFKREVPPLSVTRERARLDADKEQYLTRKAQAIQ